VVYLFFVRTTSPPDKKSKRADSPTLVTELIDNEEGDEEGKEEEEDAEDEEEEKETAEEKGKMFTDWRTFRESPY
jgi:hypothetical protein